MSQQKRNLASYVSPAVWIQLSKDIELMMHGETELSKEDQERLQHIQEWCEASPLLWKIVTRIGWEINEG